VTYTIKKLTKSDGSTVDLADPLVMTREIYTTCKKDKPEEAILTAHAFKKTVVDLAQAKADPAYGGQIKVADPAKADDIMKQKSFKFGYSYTEGTLPVLKSIKTEGNIALQYTKPVKDEEHVYSRKLGSEKVKLVPRAEAAYTGRVIYASEEEKLVARYRLKDEAPFERFANCTTNADADQKLDMIKNAIMKREEEMAGIKAKFIISSYNPFTKGNETDEFKQLQANLDYERAVEKPEDLTKLSPAMQNLIAKEKEKAELELDLGAKQNIESELQELKNAAADPSASINDATSILMYSIGLAHEADFSSLTNDSEKLQKCIDIKEAELDKFTKLETDLSALKEKTDAEKSKMNADIAKFQHGHHVLEHNLETLKKIKVGAEAKELSDPLASNEARAVAQHVKKSLTAEITRLEAAINENADFLNKTIPKLKNP
jgi:hypothetical protein